MSPSYRSRGRASKNDDQSSLNFLYLFYLFSHTNNGIFYESDAGSRRVEAIFGIYPNSDHWRGRYVDEGVEVERFRTEAVLSGWERGLGTSSSRLLGVVAAIGRERERAGERRRMLQCGGNEEEKEGRTITATSHTQAPQGKYLRHAVTT